MNSSPQRLGRVSLSVIYDVVTQLLEGGNPLTQVIFTGGEPTLLGEDLFDAIAFCSEHGLKTRMVSNVWWAATNQKALEMIGSLRESGLAEINFSLDDYHVPFIKFDHIVNAWNASKNQGFESVVIANSYGPQSLITSEYICAQLEEEIPVFWDEDGEPAPMFPPSADNTQYLISNGRLQPLGRAKTLPNEHFFAPADQKKLNKPCVWLANSLALSPGAHLLACCGIEAQGNEYLDFGDVTTEKIAELLAKANENLVIKALQKAGPYFLMNFVKQFTTEPIFKRHYGSACELCDDVVNHPLSKEILNTHLAELFPFFD